VRIPYSPSAVFDSRLIKSTNVWKFSLYFLFLLAQSRKPNISNSALFFCSLIVAAPNNFDFDLKTT
jgi:hypothetical protein